MDILYSKPDPPPAGIIIFDAIDQSMEQFVVSARKYRPLTFESVVGQQSITLTLQNAIRNNHLAQAFLFCGPRGVGKTTCARILAREINKSSTEEELTDFSFNVFELDAASNNSVEDIRQLIDQVRIPPQVGNYKVYIIDEVHMLSAAAFNAFLKTLEEPPAHAIFILATTEKHKIIPTILSRCQIFDFQRITVDDMAEHLQSIATKEGIQAEPDALHVIAQKADGGLRDALSIFDQVVSFCGNQLSYEAVIRNLNILDHDYYFKVTQQILDHNIPAALLTFDEIIAKGFDGHNFVNGLASHLRNLLVATDPSTLSLLEAGQNIRERYKEQSKLTSLRFLTSALSLLNKTDIQYKSSKQPRLLVEIMLMQLASIEQGSDQSPEKKNDFPIIKSQKPATGFQDKPAIPQSEIAIKTPIAAAKVSVQQPEVQLHAAVLSSKPQSDTVLRPGRARGISISGGIAQAQKAQGVVEANTQLMSEGPREPFTQVQLQTSWNEFVTRIRKEGKSQLAITLTMRAFRLENQSHIVLEVENAMQSELLKNEQSNLLEYLRHSLKNFGITFEARVTEDSATRMPYTTREKFNFLAEKHPSLNALRQQLDLDID